MRYQIAVWTGASQVKSIADKLREAGIEVTYEGAEHVGLVYDGNSEHDALVNLRLSVLAKYGTTFNLRPVIYSKLDDVVIAHEGKI